jgi:predicted aconitase
MSAPSIQPMFDGFDMTHWSGHVLSLLATVGAVVGVLPAIAAFAGLVWYCIQIWESKSFQKFLIGRRAKVAKKHLAYLHRQKERLEQDLRELDAAVGKAESNEMFELKGAATDANKAVTDAERDHGKPADVVGRIS